MKDVIRNLQFAHLGGYCKIVVGPIEPPLCDDHCDAQRWGSREDWESPRKVTWGVLNRLWAHKISALFECKELFPEAYLL